MAMCFLYSLTNCSALVNLWLIIRVVQMVLTDMSNRFFLHSFCISI